MTDFESWENDAFASSDIEELDHTFKRVLEGKPNPDDPIVVTLTFNNSQADRYLRAIVRAARGDDGAVAELLGFCSYVSQVLKEKDRERRS